METIPNVPTAVVPKNERRGIVFMGVMDWR